MYCHNSIQKIDLKGDRMKEIFFLLTPINTYI